MESHRARDALEFHRTDDHECHIDVAGALMAGLKAIILWFPPERITLANGWFIMLGALGAVTATAPAEIVLGAMAGRTCATYS